MQCSHFFVCKGVTNKDYQVQLCFLQLDCSSEFFRTYVGQKPEMPRAFFFLQCAGVLWGLVWWLFVGAGMCGLEVASDLL